MSAAAGRPILTAAEMRAAEDAAIAAGTPVEMLMERAGEAVADVVLDETFRDSPVLILCGPGNNGGDGYVAAAALADAGRDVRVHASGAPTTEAARQARARWGGHVGTLEEAEWCPVLVDALFGTGLKRALDPAVSSSLTRLAADNAVCFAVDVPSGVSSEDGRILSLIPDYVFTIALGALKPAHLLQPAARFVGRLRTVDIGIVATSNLHVIGKPAIPRPRPDDHKYTRGLVTVIGGAMPGAAALAALGAARAGAGYVRLASPEPITGLPHAIVQSRIVNHGSIIALLRDARIGAVVVGPGLDDEAVTRAVIGSDRPLVVDAGALAHVRKLEAPAILTPHEGEFQRRFPDLAGSKVEQARAAAREVGAVVLLKGPDTVVAAPDGRAAISRPMPSALATAGTGDVLAGVCGAMLAQLRDPFTAATAAVWLQREAAATFEGLSFLADDLAGRLAAVVDRC